MTTKKTDTALSADHQALADSLSADDNGYEFYLARVSEKRRDRIWKSVSGMRNSLHAVAPVVCMGPKKCMWHAKCPIPERDAQGFKQEAPLSDYPIGEACVLESYYMRQKILDYAIFLEVSTENPVEMSIVNELALIDLLKNRALMVLSSGDRDGQGMDLLRVDVAGFGFDQEGGSRLDMKTQKSALHPAAQFLESLERRRERWLEKLVQTRKSRQEMSIKAGTVHNDSRLLQQIAQIAEQLNDMQNKENVISAEIIDFDD